MNNKIKLVIVPLVITLSACFDSDDSSGSTTGSAINILTVSGSTLDLTGTWKTTCYTGTSLTAEPADIQETIVFSNTGTVSYVNNSFASTDANCTGTESVMSGYDADATVQTTLALSGWEDGMRVSTSAPTAQDGSSLSNNESFTDLRYELTGVNNLGGAGIGTIFQEGYIADDTSGTSSTILYRLNNNNPQPIFGSTSDPFTKM